MDQKSDDPILRQVTEIVAAYVSKNEVAAGDLPALIKSVHATLGGFAGGEPGVPGKAPAIAIKKSVTPDYIVCLEDGKKLKMLKRYLRARYGLTPDAYRAKWNLPADYPMTAPNYAAKRSDFAKQIGLGKPVKKNAADFVRAASGAFWLAALLVVLAFPFFFVDVPPVLDYPNHLARFFVLAHPDDPILSRFYAPHWVILPNLGFDLVGPALLNQLPVHVAGRILLYLSLIAPLLGVMAYSKAAFGKVTGWSFAAGAAAFNGVFFLGFMNFLLSLGLAFGAASLWMSLRRRSWLAAMLMGTLASGVIFLCHIFGAALFALLIASFEAERLWARGRAHKDYAATAALLAVTLAPALVLYLLSPVAAAGGAPGAWEYWRKGWELFTPFMTYSKVLTLLTGALLFGFLILGLRGARYAPGARLALALLALGYFFAPDTLKGGTFVDVRLALMLGLLLFAGIAPPPRFGRLAGFALAALIVARSASVAMTWNSHGAYLSDLRAAMAEIPPGAKVLAAQGPAQIVITDLYRMDSHMPALLVIERRAFWPLLFADAGQQPLIVRPPYDRMAQPLPSDTPDWGALQLKNWRSDFDYVLLIAPPSPLSAPAGLVPLYAGQNTALWRVAR